MPEPHLMGLYVFVTNIDASLHFYQQLGIETMKLSDSYARVSAHDGVLMVLGTSELTSSYDPKHQLPATGSKATFNFELDSAAAVEDKFAEMVTGGYTGHLAPIDAPWQARFAVVLGPDGHQIGLHSPPCHPGSTQRDANP